MSQNSSEAIASRHVTLGKIFGIIALVLVLLVIIGFTGVGGEHGPGRHIPAGDVYGHTAHRTVGSTVMTMTPRLVTLRSARMSFPKYESTSKERNR
jgi:hypothetical protein